MILKCRMGIVKGHIRKKLLLWKNFWNSYDFFFNFSRNNETAYTCGLLGSISWAFPDFPLSVADQEASLPPPTSPNHRNDHFSHHTPSSRVSADRGTISCLKRGCEIGFFVKRDIFKHRPPPPSPMHRLPISEGHGKVQRLLDGHSHPRKSYTCSTGDYLERCWDWPGRGC